MKVQWKFEIWKNPMVTLFLDDEVPFLPTAGMYIGSGPDDYGCEVTSVWWNYQTKTIEAFVKEMESEDSDTESIVFAFVNRGWSVLNKETDAS